LGGTGVGEIADHLAQRLVHLLPLETCVVFLYDSERVHLIETARAVRAGSEVSPEPHPISLERGALESDLEAGPGGFALPLYDSRHLHGVVSGQPIKGSSLTRAQVDLARALSYGTAISITVARSTRAVPHEDMRSHPQPFRTSSLEAMNPYLWRYLSSALERTCLEEPVTVVMARLAGTGSRGFLPSRGRPIVTSKGANTGRGFSCFGPESSQIALVLLRTGRAKAVRMLTPHMSRALSLWGLVGPPGNTRGVRPEIAAMAITVCPDDTADPGTLLAAACDLLDLQTYLAAARDREGRDPVYQLPGDATAIVMDSHFLAEEIDRQRQVLEEAVASGLGFQDTRVREMSEHLDRLIVVMQRFMGFTRYHE